VLRSREQQVLAAGGVAALLIFLLSFLVIPAVDKIKAQGRARAQAERDLVELRSAVPSLKAIAAQIAPRKALLAGVGTGQDSPLSRLTARLQEAGFPQSAFSIKSGGVKDGEYVKEESFDVKIENRSYLELVRFVGKLEDGTMPVTIRSVNFKSRYENSSAIDASLRIGYLLAR
jgi:hypothetical protein